MPVPLAIASLAGVAALAAAGLGAPMGAHGPLVVGLLALALLAVRGEAASREG